MSQLTTPLLDATDTRQRVRQHILLLVGTADVLLGVAFLLRGALGQGPVVLIVGLALLLPGIAVFVMASRTLQQFETTYKGHRIRFTNSPLTAERLYIDERQVDRGGFGLTMHLEGTIPSGDGAGDTIVATSTAGFTSFRCRIEARSPAK